MSKRTNRFLYPAFLILASGLLLEIVLRAGWVPLTYDMNGLRIRFDRDVGYEVEPPLKSELNNVGFRGTAIRPGDGKKKLILLGDSMIYGWGVPYEKTLTARLIRSLGDGWDVVNMGVVGYGPDQSYVQLKKIGLKLKPTHVILGVFPANDFKDIDRVKLFEPGKDGRVRKTKRSLIDRYLSRLEVINFFRYLKFALDAKMGRDTAASPAGRLFYEFFEDNYDFDLLSHPDSAVSKRKIELMRCLLRSFHEDLKKRGISFLVLIIPSYETLYAPEELKERGVPSGGTARDVQLVESICREERIPTLNLLPPFRKNPEKLLGNPPSDRHLNPQGHAAAATLIRNALRRPS